MMGLALITLALPAAAGPLAEMSRALEKAASGIRPAVVAISSPAEPGRRTLFDAAYETDNLNTALDDFNEMLQTDETILGQAAGWEAVVRERGSGVNIRADGLIVTNAHVVEGLDRVEAVFADGRTFEAWVVGRDKRSDIALVRVPAEAHARLPFLDWAGTERLKPGAIVLAIGNPGEMSYSVTMGILSGKGRALAPNSDRYDDLLQIDAAINPGNSGGALADAHGRLVGIISSRLRPQAGWQGIGFAIPSEMARGVVEKILKVGSVRYERGYLGLRMRDGAVPAPGGGRLHGAEIVGFAPASPGKDGGLKRGDLVVGFDGAPVRAALELRRRIAFAGPGAPLSLEVRRNGSPRTLELEAGRQGSPLIGVATANLSDEQRALGKVLRESPLHGALSWGVLDARSTIRPKGFTDDLTGIRIAHLELGSPLERSGLRNGDVILEVNERSIGNWDDVARELRRAKSGVVPVRILRYGKIRSLQVRLDPAAE